MQNWICGLVWKIITFSHRVKNCWNVQKYVQSTNAYDHISLLCFFLNDEYVCVPNVLEMIFELASKHCILKSSKKFITSWKMNQILLKCTYNFRQILLLFLYSSITIQIISRGLIYHWRNLSKGRTNPIIHSIKFLSGNFQ